MGAHGQGGCGRALQAALLLVPVWIVGDLHAQGVRTYVGSAECEPCHEVEYRNFQAYSRKARSYQSVQKLRAGLTDQEYRECLGCHTTGYGRPGGFRSETETPGLKDAGCEVCHGPGSAHVESADRADVKGTLTARDCEVCHNEERVAAFRYKPLVYGGAH